MAEPGLQGCPVDVLTAECLSSIFRCSTSGR